MRVFSPLRATQNQRETRPPCHSSFAGWSRQSPAPPPSGSSPALPSDGITGIIVLGLILALVNTSLKPIVQILSLPLTFMTFGIFYLIVDTLMLYVAGWLSNGLFNVGVGIAGFGSAFLASIIISIVSALVNGAVAK